MKISLNWLKEYLPLAASGRELAESLVKLGFEVADIKQRTASFQGVVAGEILSIAPHPQADRLSLCSVTDGTSTFSVICGAKNIAVGQKIPLARLGALLPGGLKISHARIRGVESEGMLCSSAELGLGEGNGGILLLPPETSLGADLAGTLASPDEILDVEITPNRPDCLSHRGLARELAAFLRLPLETPQLPGGPPAQAGTNLSLEIKEPQACPRYVGRLFSNLEIKPSPGWLAQRLQAVGLRPINNLVDITNFILMDIGQPLHAFDAAALEGGKIIVRYAAAGETIQALDGKLYTLNPECLVIADNAKPQAIAGVMGGQASAIGERTTRAFLESAHFAPAVVRKASKFLELKSDSSYRFERGTDPEAASLAAQTAGRLIAALCGKKVSASSPTDAYPRPEPRRTITVSTSGINRILGSSYPARDIEKILTSVAAALTAHGEHLTFTPPSYRGDLSIQEDLAEEAARLLGYEAIGSRLAPCVPTPLPETAQRRLQEKLCRRLESLGIMEAFNYDFTSEKTLAQARIKESAQAGFARFSRPLNEDWAVLRPSLIPGLLQNARLNLSRGVISVRLFESGRIYSSTPRGIQEKAGLAGILLGPRSPWHWQTRNPSRCDLFDAKGVVEDLTSIFPGLSWSLPQTLEGPSSLFHPAGSLCLTSSEGTVGLAGLLNPAVARAWDLAEENACVFELDLDILSRIKPRAARFVAPSPFPGSQRDLSFFTAREIPYARIREAIQGLGLQTLQGLDVLDVYEGRGVPDGQKSLTLRFSFGLYERTLKDAEVKEAVENICEELKKTFSIVWRA